MRFARRGLHRRRAQYTFEARAASQYSWYPINFYDPREGFPRDAAPAGMANPACYVNGIMNAVEFDVGNF